MSEHQHRKSVKDLLVELQKGGGCRANLPKMKRNNTEYPVTIKANWKGSGYCNREFQTVKPIQTKMLSTWQIERVGLADRTFKAPKDFKGFKNGLRAGQFSTPPYSFRMGLQKISESRKQKEWESGGWGMKQSKRYNSQKSLKFQISKDTYFGFSSQTVDK